MGSKSKIAARKLLQKYMKPESGDKLEGWGEAEMRTIKTMVRTKSGKLVEKTIMVSKDDYDKLKELGTHTLYYYFHFFVFENYSYQFSSFLFLYFNLHYFFS